MSQASRARAQNTAQDHYDAMMPDDDDLTGCLNCDIAICNDEDHDGLCDDCEAERLDAQ